MIENYLCKGKERKRTKAELCLCMNVTTRQLRKIIEDDRKSGLIVLSTADNGGGYFLPDDGEKGKSELAIWYRKQGRMIASNAAIMRPVKKQLDCMV